MSEILKSKLSKLETKVNSVVDDTEIKFQEGLLINLEMFEYLNRQMQMTMTSEEIRQADEEGTAGILIWYSRWQKMTEEERKLESDEREKEVEKERLEFRVWRLSDVGKLFDLEYAKRFGPHEAVDGVV
jgi:hypothetical protein